MSNLKAIKRERTSSGSNNKLRAEGLVPAILYGGTNPNQNISVQKKDLKNITISKTVINSVSIYFFRNSNVIRYLLWG